MWWYISKLIDNESEIIYAYGFETRETTGKVRYDRKKDEFECLKLADGDSEFCYERLLPHVYRAIFKENAPDKRQISTG